jgi:hypothetical protein
MKQMNIANNIKDLDFSAAASIKDKQTLDVLSTPVDTDVLNDVELVEDFVQQYKSWISTSTNNKFIGLDNYQYACYSAATSEAFDKFYMKNSSKRFRCFRGEYIYHKIAWRDKFAWAYIDDDELRTGDAVIISLPFADTGNKHISYDEVLDTCERLGIPVLIDCCYFGVCSDIEFNLNYECITDVAFSLSKAFPVAHARIGMRLTKEDNDDTLFAYNKPGLMYTNRLTASLGKRFITEFSPDYMYNTYREKQLEYCQLTSTTPSNTVFFGIGDKKWQKYNRGTDTNRLSFHRYLT